MRRIVFLVKNYIGFGHIRRTLLIAEEISALAPDVDIVFVSQAKSLRLFQGTRYRVVNFPFLHRLPTNAFASAYRVLLNQIIANLNPTLVIEDTYPDEWYLSVPALQYVPKILILRRVDSLSFDDFRREGFFSVYDRVLMVRDEQEFFAETQVAESELLVKLTDIFRFVGPVFHLPTNDELDRVKEKYVVQDKSLVVVNAGAGGDQFNDAYGERLFMALSQVAQRFLSYDTSVHFVFVVGPYYKGIQPKSYPNVTTVDFEPLLAALFHVADVAIIKPSYNVTHETLSGPAEVILVPGISYKETLHFYARYLRERYKAHIGSYDDVDLLFNLTRDILNRSSRGSSREQIVPCQAKAAEAIIEELDNLQTSGPWNRQCESVNLLLLVGNIHHAERVRASLRSQFPQIAFVVDQQVECEGDIPSLNCLIEEHRVSSEGKSSGRELPFIFLQVSTTMDCTDLVPKTLVDLGTKVVLYTDKTKFGVTAKEWCKHYPPRNHGLLEMELHHFEVMPGRSLQSQLSYRVSKMSLQNNVVAIYLDLSLLTEWAEVEVFIEHLSNWLQSGQCYLLALDQAVKKLAISQLALGSVGNA